MTKKELEKNKELARLYYLNGDTQKLIAERIGISRVTIGKWISDGGWDTIRTAKSITRKELVSKMMSAASEKLDNNEMSFDEMSKLAATIKELDKQTNVVTLLEVFTLYDEWLVARMQIDKELSAELVKTMNRYQDIFISEQLSKGKIVLDGE